MAYLSCHAPGRHPEAHAGRPVQPDRRLSYRSGASGRQGADHPRPFGSRARGPRRGAGDAGNARHDAPALRRELRRLDAGDRVWRELEARRRRRCRSIRPDTCSARRRFASRRMARAWSRPATTRMSRTRPARRSSWCGATPSSPRRRSACRCSATATRGAEIAKLLRSVALFPERAHLVGAYSLGKAQRVIALIRAGRLRPADLPARRDGEHHAATTSRAASISASCAPCATPRRRSSPARSRSARRPSLQDRWTRRFPDPVSAFASGWMRVRARARQRGVELPLVISDHADWDGLTATVAATGASQIWVTHGAEEALVHWCTLRGLEARPLGMVGYGDEDEGAAEAAPAESRSMNRFAALLDRLAYEPSRNAKLRLLTDYFRTTPDPDRGYALAAITGALSFRHAKPGIIRALIAERTDPVLFELSYDYVGDLSETVALMWPTRSAPSPRERGGLGGGSVRAQVARRPPPQPLPHKGEGNSPIERQRPHPRPRRHHPRLARQIRAAGAARRLARRARRDRALGAAEARHRRAAHRRVGAARQDRGRGAGRQGARRGRAGVARPRAALRGAVRLDRRPCRKAGQHRSGAVPPGDAEPCDRGDRTFRRSIRRTSPPNGNGTASACRRSPARRTAGASRGSIRAPARTFPARFPI